MNDKADLADERRAAAEKREQAAREGRDVKPTPKDDGRIVR